MHNLKNKLMDHENNNDNKRCINPSFSSTLLDQIYRSIDQQQGGESKSPQMKKFFRETITRKTEEKKKQSENVVVGVFGTERFVGGSRRNRRSRDSDQDVTCFSSASFSSDYSTSSFSSSSDTEYSSRSRASSSRSRASSSSCFAPPRPKPVRTSASSFRYEEQRDQSNQHRRFNSFRSGSKNAEPGVSRIGGENDEAALLIKSKSRAMKIYNNLKKAKQPISPGGKITSFLNSIFASSKKTVATTKSCPIKRDQLYGPDDSTTIKSGPMTQGWLHGSDDARVSYKDANNNVERSVNSIQVSACSSASSFSRSCLSKTNSSERDRLRNGAKRTVRFYPVSVVVGEDCRPCEHKRVCDEQEEDNQWKIGKSHNSLVEKSRVVEEAAREFLEEYRRNNNKKNNESVLSDLNDEDDEDDDALSCASSDLFELDHKAVSGDGRYCEELPVYETTRVSTNRAIANGLLV